MLGKTGGRQENHRTGRLPSVMSRWRCFQVSCQGQSRWNSIVRVTLVTLGSPGLRAGKSPAFLVLRGLARPGRSWVKKAGIERDYALRRRQPDGVGQTEGQGRY